MPARAAHASHSSSNRPGKPIFLKCHFRVVSVSKSFPYQRALWRKDHYFSSSSSLNDLLVLTRGALTSIILAACLLGVRNLFLQQDFTNCMWLRDFLSNN